MLMEAPLGRRPGTSQSAGETCAVIIGPFPGPREGVKDCLCGVLAPEAVFACRSVAQAEAEHDPDELGVIVFDLRERAVTEVALEVRQARRTFPDAELLLIAADASAPTLAACLQVCGAPEKLTFLLAPLHPPMVAQTLQSIIQRRVSALSGRRQSAHSESARASLELQVQELGARLEIAKHAARHDDLTGALNRSGFIEELSARLARNRQNQNILMIDLDRFKSVNDTLGHSAGDELVRKICTGIQAVIPADALLARLGGDEFGILIETGTEDRIAHVSAAVLKVCSQTRFVLGHEVQVSASIGVARGAQANTESELMRQADLAMYAAKREGRNRVRTFDAALDKATKYRLGIEGGLERALRAGQLKMAYQPIVKALTGEITGFEALVRWESAEHGFISPAEFITVAEESGLILDLGDWITRRALRDCRRWPKGYVSINLSARQFLRHNVGERILRYAREADVPPEKIQIELTETAIIDDVERADFNLKIMRNAGIRVALDDFGTGYSSLVYLKQFAIDCIKIDKSFVDNIRTDKQSAVIVASVTKLAASLGMDVVAEGVETADQRQILIAAGCDALQGYFFSEPVSADEALAMNGG